MKWIFFLTFYFISLQQSSHAAVEINLSNRHLNANQADSISVSFRLHSDMNTTIKFINLYGGEAIIIEDQKFRRSGLHKIYLSSKSMNLHEYSSGIYYFSIHGEKDLKRVMEFNSFQEPWGEMVTATDVQLNDESGEISYNLPKICFVKVRVGLQEGPLLYTIKNWEPQPVGRQVFQWNGLDQASKVTVIDRFKCLARVLAFGIPRTAFYFQNQSKPINFQLPPAYPKDWQQFTIDPHANVPWPDNKDVPLDFDVDFADDSTFLIKFPEQTKDFNKIYSTNNEVYISLDNKFICENPQVVIPSQYMIACQKVSRGRHIMLVNIILENNRIASGVKEILF